jgi:aspartyl/asparaginyl beta-hydroxylase (cupin superfamily)
MHRDDYYMMMAKHLAVVVTQMTRMRRKMHELLVVLVMAIVIHAVEMYMTVHHCNVVDYV